MQVSSGGSRGLQSEINITPLVDVVLVLLIIFMVVVPMLMEGYDVDIPRASAGAAQSQEAQVVLSIAPAWCALLEPPKGEGLPTNCQVTLADEKIPATELSKRVAEVLGSQPVEKRVLFLNVDDRVNYEGVLRIVDLAKSNVEGLKIEFLTTQ